MDYGCQSWNIDGSRPRPIDSPRFIGERSEEASLEGNDHDTDALAQAVHDASIGGNADGVDKALPASNHTLRPLDLALRLGEYAQYVTYVRHLLCENLGLPGPRSLPRSLLTWLPRAYILRGCAYRRHALQHPK